MKKFLSYILIFIILFGIFGLVPIKQARAQWSNGESPNDDGTCQETAWTYKTCVIDHPGGVSALQANSTTSGVCTLPYNFGSCQTQSPAGIFTPSAPLGTCTNGDTLMGLSERKNCGSLSKWIQQGGVMCTGQIGTPPGCNADISVPGSTCLVTQSNTSRVYNDTRYLDITGIFNLWGNTFDDACNSDSGKLNSPTTGASTCTISDWSPQTCTDLGGKYSPTGQTPGTTVAPLDTSNYTLLEPLPNTSGGQLKTLNVSSTNSLGGYLNPMITIFIGICAVLAVIMILFGGIEYMTSELISSKEAGKERIRNALLGLVLALGAWSILHTINPNLLNSDINAPDINVQVTIQDETETPQSAVLNDEGAPSGPTAGCPEGIGRTNGGISVCNRIVSGVNAMVSAASAAGINLSGGGYRSPQSQTALRVKNCQGSNTTDRNASCTPPTAVPGSSRHQQGLAIDFKCDGTLIQNNTNKCYVWLASNAGKYGLANLASEPWHWSVDGR